MKKRSENNFSRKGAKGAKVRKISKCPSLRAWRPFGFAQDMLGAINFLKLVLLSIAKVRI